MPVVGSQPRGAGAGTGDDGEATGADDGVEAGWLVIVVGVEVVVGESPPEPPLPAAPPGTRTTTGTSAKSPVMRRCIDAARVRPNSANALFRHAP